MTRDAQRSVATTWAYVMAALVLVGLLTLMLVRIGPSMTPDTTYAPYTESVTEPYAPYEAGPVIHESDLYAPYTESVTEPYAPYEAGPVIHESDLTGR